MLIVVAVLGLGIYFGRSFNDSPPPGACGWEPPTTAEQQYLTTEYGDDLTKPLKEAHPELFENPEAK